MSQFRLNIQNTREIYFIDDVYIAIKDDMNDVLVYDYNFVFIGIGYCPNLTDKIPLKIAADAGMIHVYKPNYRGLFCIVSEYNTDRDAELYHKNNFMYKSVPYRKHQRIYKIPKDIHIMYWHTKIIKPIDLYRYMLIQFYSCTDIANTIGWYMLEHKRLDLTHYPKG